MANKATFFLLFLIFIFPLSFSQPHFPHIICGFVFYDGSAVAGANVTITNERTGEILYNITNEDGYFSISLGDMPSGWKNGDKIKIIAKKADLIGEAAIIVDESVGFQEINITMGLPPEARFDYSPLHPIVNEKIKFYSLVNASYYQWNFDDGNISTEKNPEHVYKKPGNYSVTLTIKDRYGRVNAATKTIYVAPGSNQNNNFAHQTNEHKDRVYLFGVLAIIVIMVVLALIWKILK